MPSCWLAKLGMALRVPVLGQDDMGRHVDEPVDGGDDGITIRYGKGAAGAEIVLDIDDNQR